MILVESEQKSDPLLDISIQRPESQTETLKQIMQIKVLNKMIIITYLWSEHDHMEGGQTAAHFLVVA